MPFPTRTDLVLGRGEVYFDRFNEGARVGVGERYIGNTPSFQITRTVQRAGRKTSYRGQVHEEMGHVVSEDISLSIVTDNMSWQNVADWFNAGPFGEQVLPGSEALPFTETLVVYQERFYTLGMGLSETGTLAVDRIAGIRVASGNSLRPGIDWDLDLQRGRIYIPLNSPRVPNGAEIIVTYYKRPSGVFRAFARRTELFGAVRYIARNVVGSQTDYFFPMVRLTPQGAWDQKGDQFQQLRYSATAMRLNPNAPLAYLMRVGGLPQAITADSSLVRADTTQYRADNANWAQ